MPKKDARRAGKPAAAADNLNSRHDEYELTIK